MASTARYSCHTLTVPSTRVCKSTQLLEQVCNDSPVMINVGRPVSWTTPISCVGVMHASSNAITRFRPWHRRVLRWTLCMKTSNQPSDTILRSYLTIEREIMRPVMTEEVGYAGGVGSILSIFVTAGLQQKYGYRRIIQGGLVGMFCSIFLQFFSVNLVSQDQYCTGAEADIRPCTRSLYIAVGGLGVFSRLPLLATPLRSRQSLCVAI
jgi:hypothetical protein